MLDLTTDTDLDLALLPRITIMLLVGQVIRQLFGWIRRPGSPRPVVGAASPLP